MNGLRRPRLIPRLDIKGNKVIKGVQFEGLRVIGNPAELARRYAEDADELLYLDTVASLYGRNQLVDLLTETTADVFIPITVGGGIKSCGDAERLFRAGADSIAVNTAAVQRPKLIDELAQHFGSQAVTVSIEAKQVNGGWEAYTNHGRDKSGKDVVEWCREAVSRGDGQILLTSIDQDGTMRGLDLPLVRACSVQPVPILASGGAGNADNLREVSELVDGIAIGALLHYSKTTLKEIRELLCSSPIAAIFHGNQPLSQFRGDQD